MERNSGNEYASYFMWRGKGVREGTWPWRIRVNYEVYGLPFFMRKNNGLKLKLN